MSDTAVLLPASVLRKLADKLYETRKNAAQEVQGIIVSLTIAGDHEKIYAVISILANDYALSPQANPRKGGLIGLAATAMGLASESTQYIDRIVPPVLKLLTDQDNHVRYYACEALYNIAQVCRGNLIVYFNDIFDALCKLSTDSSPSIQSAAHVLDQIFKDIVAASDEFSMEEFIPLLRERMTLPNPFVRRFLVGWVTVLYSVPHIDVLGFLPCFLDGKVQGSDAGLFNMLSDSSHEIRQQADSVLSEFLDEIKNVQSVDYGRMTEILVQQAISRDEFTRLTSITWIHDFVKLGKQVVQYYADILGAIMPAISDKEEKICLVARKTNEELRAHIMKPIQGFDVGALLNVARRQLRSEFQDTRLESLKWILLLLGRYRAKVLFFISDLFPALLHSLSDKSDEVVLLVLEAHACIASDGQNFRHLMISLVQNFKEEPSLLKNRGTLAFRRLCVLLGAERVYRELATILEGESDVEFATVMVQALNLILLTAPELLELRELLQKSSFSSQGTEIFVALYTSWCHSPMTTISLCLLAQAYQHITEVIHGLRESDINEFFLMQLSKLVQLLETPVFANTRFQLLEPARYPALLKSLYSILMLLPQQSTAFKLLLTRLRTVPTDILTQIQTDIPSESNLSSNIDFAKLLQHFKEIQEQHRLHRHAQA